MYVHYELSYDKFFEDSDRIYRIALERKYPDHTRNFASSSVMLAPTLLENYPEVETAILFSLRCLSLISSKEILKLH
jgi:putative ABC transport system permease protein